MRLTRGHDDLDLVQSASGTKVTRRDRGDSYDIVATATTGGMSAGLHYAEFQLVQSSNSFIWPALVCADADLSQRVGDGANRSGFAPVSYTHLTLPTKA